MSSRDRLRELYESGEKALARDFAKGVLQNQSVEQYDVEGSTVTVETDLFIGTHDIVTDENDDLDVEKKGTYEIKLDGVSLTVDARSALSSVIDDVRAEVQAHGSPTDKPRKTAMVH